jgi:DNA-binding response OmpR family regulator
VSARQRRILVVDDDPRNAKLLVDLLTAEGYEAAAVGAGEAALALDPPDLMLLDVMMPGLSGYEVCRALRASPRTAILPVVMVTAADPAEERLRGLEAGADDFLGKPVDPEELLVRVRSLLRIKTLHERVETQAQELAALNAGLEARVRAQVDELERLARLKRFFSPAVADVLVAGDAADPLRTHRAEVTAVAVALRGFTAFAETAEPEEVMAVLREYHAAMGAAVVDAAATVERFTSDGMVLVLNDPVPVVNPAARAVAMALAMRAACSQTLADRWRDRGYDLDFVVGIAQGYATVGTIGFEGRRDYGVVGVVTDLALALAASASPGQVLVTRRVLTEAGADVAHESVGTLALAGFTRPVEVYDVAGPRGDREVLDAAPSVAPEAAPNVFRCDGDFWTIAYQGKQFRVRGSRGFVYLAALLGQPGQRIPATELAGLGADPDAKRISAGELRASGLRAGETSEAGELLDASARAAYRRRLGELNEELERARAFNDPGRATALQEEIDFILQELASAVGLGGRARKAGSAAERARLNVTRAIRSAIERIGAHHRPLARYLATTISTGLTCAYDTEFRTPVVWVLR